MVRKVSGQEAEGLRLKKAHLSKDRTHRHSGDASLFPCLTQFSWSTPPHSPGWASVPGIPESCRAASGVCCHLQASCGTASSCPALKGALPAFLSLEGMSHVSSSVYTLMELLKGSNDLYISGPQLDAGTEEVFNM